MRPTSLFRTLLALLALAIPVNAQLNPKLVSKYDLLDVYKGSTAKPEFLSVFDFSGSMIYMYWHSGYYTNPTADMHGSPWVSGDDDPKQNRDGIVVTVDSYLKVNFNKEEYLKIYPGYKLTANLVVDSGYLVKPNGEIIDHLSSAIAGSDVKTYVRQASHVRMKAFRDIDGKRVERVVDIPIPWTVFDEESYSSNASNQILKLVDPKGGPDLEVDPIYSTSKAGIDDFTLLNMSYKAPGPYRIGYFTYGVDYLWWIFFGMDKATGDDENPYEDTKKFVVPAVDTNAPELEPSGSLVKSFTWKNGIPGMTRVQALKYAVVYTWLKNQGKVWWGYRTLDTNEQAPPPGILSDDNGSSSSKSISRDIRLFNCATSSSQPGSKVKHFLEMLPSGGTPLTRAVANSYAQLTKNQKYSTFGPGSGDCTGQDGTDVAIPACRTTFMAVFTDGFATDGPGNGDPFAVGRDDGIAKIKTNVSNVNPGGDYFNVWTLSGIAAHYPDDGTLSGQLNGYAPFAIKTRGATTTSSRRVRTISVAMALGGSVLEDGSGKRELLKMALYGNENDDNWDIKDKPYNSDDPSTNSDSPYFFDARSPKALVKALTDILALVTKASNSVAAPSSPLVGLSLGRQAYLGLFETASNGPRWKGDLLMAGIRANAKGVVFLDANGQETEKITSAAGSAVWSANTHLTTQKSWLTRNVLTTLSTSSNTLVDLKEGNADITAAMVGAADATQRQRLIRFLRGATLEGETDPSKTEVRPMGDLISSSPAAVEFPLSAAAGSTKLAAAISKYQAAKYQDIRFRLILVADNHGYLHGFGEASGTEVLTEGTPAKVKGYKVHGEVEELWAFMPYELLKVGPYLKDNANPHRYFFDGSPHVYHLDVPGTNQVVGNGLVDGEDVVRVIVGLRKGGRSYYAFDVKEPFTPALSWQLIPDDTVNYGTVSGLTDEMKTAIGRMGLATAVPAIARMDVSADDRNQDLVFLGGGLSTPNIDAAMGVKLGRSIIALKVQTGKAVKVWDFLANPPGDTSVDSPIGAISTGVVPFEFFPNSRKAQRVYFVDQPTDSTRGSALWALGGTTLVNNDTIRVDSSLLSAWGVRKIFQADKGLVISSSPAPFRMDRFPVGRTADPKLVPAAVGVAFGTGDRNDPMDKDAIEPPLVGSGTSAVAYNRFVVVFDRQDSANLSSNSPAATDVNTKGLGFSNLIDLSSVAGPDDAAISPSSVDYYLKKGFGYYLKTYGQIGTNVVKDPLGNDITRPAVALSLLKNTTTNQDLGESGRNTYYAKVVSSPVVLSGVGFFSSFLGKDDAGECKGGGATITYRLCNIMAPIYRNGYPMADPKAFNTDDDTTNTDTNGINDTYCSGIIQTFVNIAGELTAMGTTGILQSGQGTSTTGTGEISSAGAEVQGALGKKGNFSFRPRTWRVIR